MYSGKKYLMLLLVALFSFLFFGGNSVDIDSTVKSYVPPNPEVFNTENQVNNDLDAKYEPNLLTAPDAVAKKFVLAASDEMIPAQGTTGSALVIRIEFQDEKFDADHDTAHFNGLMNELVDYFEYNSKYDPDVNGYTFGFVLTDVITSSKTMAYYGSDSDMYNTDDLNTYIGSLAVESLDILDNDGFDFSPFDQNDDGEVDHLIIIHAGQGQEEGGSTERIWSHSGLIDSIDLGGGLSVDKYIMMPESGQLGVYAHEFGHDIGLPDLYDADGLANGETNGIGAWGIMGSGSWNHLDGEEAGATPSNLCAWSREFLGWIEPIVITTDMKSLRVRYDIDRYSEIYKIYPRGDVNSKEYYLLETRVQYGYDAALPGGGLLLWHVDEEMIDLFSPFNAVNNFKGRLGIELEQVDGTWDIWAMENDGDSTDVLSSQNSHKLFSASPYGLNFYNADPSEFTYVDVVYQDDGYFNNKVDVYVTPKVIYEAPDNLMPKDVSLLGLTPKFSWDYMPQTEGYLLEISTHNDFSEIERSYDLRTVLDGLYIDRFTYSFELPDQDALQPLTTYYWRISGYNSMSDEIVGWSETRRFITDYPEFAELEFEPLNIEKHPTEPLIFMGNWDDKEIEVINLDNGDRNTISLPINPWGMTVWNNKLYVCLSPTDHRMAFPNYSAPGAVAIIDMTSLVIDEIVALAYNPYDICIDIYGNIFISAADPDIVSYDSDFNEIDYDNYSSGNNYIEYDKEHHKIYMMKQTVSPEDFECYSIDNFGNFVDSYDSIYHDDVYMDDEYYMLPSFDYILNGSGYVYSITDDEDTDLRMVTQLNDDFLAATACEVEQRIYTIGNDGLQVYEYSTFNHLASFDIVQNVVDIQHYGDSMVLFCGAEDEYFIYQIEKSLLEPIGPVIFSFDGSNSNRILCSDDSLEFSLDGGMTYYDISNNSHRLTSSQLDKINSVDDIVIRKKMVTPAVNNEIVVIEIFGGPDAPEITSNDNDNTLTGITNEMSFSTDNGNSWVVYNNNLPDLSGNVTLKIRYSGVDTIMPSESVTVKFTKPAASNPPVPSGGGGIPFIPLPLPQGPIPGEVKLDDVLADIEDDAEIVVSVPLEKDDNVQSVSINEDVLDALKKNDKPIELDGETVDIVIPPNTFGDKVKDGEQLELKVAKVDKSELELSTSNEGEKSEGGLFAVGDTVFEFTASVISGDKTSEVSSFEDKLTISILLSDEELKNVDKDKLGVYYYNETTNEWEYVGGIFNPDTGEVVFTTDHFSYYTVMEYYKTFDDIAQHWAKSYVEKLASRYITKGKSDTIFDPDATTTKSEFSALVVRAIDMKVLFDSRMPYEDVSNSKWYYNEIQNAYSYGLLDTNVMFNPEAEITREQMTKIIVEAMKNVGTYESIADEEVDSILSVYNDSETIDPVYREAVALAIKNGIINGRTATAIEPKATATRAETMVVVSRLLDIINKDLLD